MARRYSFVKLDVRVSSELKREGFLSQIGQFHDLITEANRAFGFFKMWLERISLAIESKPMADFINGRRAPHQHTALSWYCMCLHQRLHCTDEVQKGRNSVRHRCLQFDNSIRPDLISFKLAESFVSVCSEHLQQQGLLAFFLFQVDEKKRSCVRWLGVINLTWENLQIAKHKSVSWTERTPSWFVLSDL